MADEDGIVIRIDLDSDEYKKQLKDLKKESSSTSKDVGDSLDKNIAKVLNDRVADSVKDTTSLIKKMNSAIANIGAKVAIITPIIIFLEKRFGLFTDIFKTFGVDLESLIKQVKRLGNTFAKVLSGGADIGDLKAGIGLVLQELGLLDKLSLDIFDTFLNFVDVLPRLASGALIFAAMAKPMALVARNIKEITKFGAGLAAIVLNPKGLFSATAALGALSISLGTFGAALVESENKAARFAGKISILASVITGTLATAISVAIIKLGQFLSDTGSELVVFFDNVSKAFNKNEKDITVFEAAVNSVNRSVKGSIGTFQVWEAIVGQMANTFNVARDGVRKSAQEILLVGPKLGLVEDQMRKLLRVSVEYAKINKKEVFQTTVNFVNALNGNAQAVAALGVKLTAASLQQFAYSKGITKTIEKMSEQEKVTLRFSKVMKQYKEVMGIGVVAGASLADQQDRLDRNIKNVNTSLGEGARIIESNNVLAFAYNKILGNLSPSIFKLTGFLGALGARFLQVGGLVLEFSFKIFAVVKIVKILQALFLSGVGVKAFAATIPFLNTSLNVLISRLAGTSVQVVTLSGLMTSMGLIVKTQLNAAFVLFFRTSLAGATVLNVLSGALVTLKLSLVRVYQVLLPLLIPLAKIIAVIAIVVAVVYGLVEAFRIIEDRTQALSELWNTLLGIFETTGSVFAPIIGDFNMMVEAIKTLVYKGFGLFISGIAGIIGILTALAKRNPFSVFSKDTIVKLASLENRIKHFRDELSGIGHDVRLLSGSVGRSVSGMADSLRFTAEEMARILNTLRERYKDFGLTQSQVLAKQLEVERAALVQFIEVNNLKGQALAEHLLLKEQLEKDYLTRIQAARDQETLNSVASFENVQAAFRIHAKKMKTTAGDLAKTMLNISVRGFGRAFQAIGAALASGGNAMQAFADSVKATFGEIASALGDFYIKKGIALSADPTTPGSGAGLIAAGAAMKVLSGALGGTSTSSGTAGSGGGSSSGSGGIQDVSSGEITQASAERPEADTNLQVVINGDILDGQETGNRMIDILNESFGKEGVILRDVRQA